MSSSSPLPNTPMSKDEEESKKISEEFEHLIETLPKGSGWWFEHLYKYKGSWLGSVFIKGNLVLNTCFKSEPTDIILASVMKSGTTWLKALMFSILNRHRYSLSDHFLHHHGPHDSIPILDMETYPFTDYTNVPAPRLFATHFHRALLPPSMASCKFVYICREPKDVFISNWHFMSKLRLKHLPPFSFEEAFDLFCQGVSDYGPFWEHVLSYWKASLETPEKILFLKYEDVKAQPEVVLKRLAEFMGKPFTAEEVEEGVVEEIVKLCSFENLSNLEVNKKGFQDVSNVDTVEQVENSHFFRKGQIGDWKNHLSEEMKQRIDGITHEKLKGSGLSFGVST